MKTDFSGLKKECIIKLKKHEQKPFFHDLKPDISSIRKFAEKYMEYKNIIIIGNGGAVNSFLVIYKALYHGEKKVTIINSMEPDLISRTLKNNPADKTLVIASSTSGTNVGALEIMSAFMDYNMVVITAQNNGALRMIAQHKGLAVQYVPHMTDRFLTSGSLAYFPLALLGIDIEKFDSELHKAYEKYSMDNNDAQKLSEALLQLENEGYTEVFVPVYSNSLESFSIYIMQLMHESVCKDGKGQTFLVVGAPESQHHTNQRFFGGRKNICSLFITAGQNDSKSKVNFSEDLAGIGLRDGSLGDIIGVPLSKSFEFEFLGTYKDALANGIPSAVMHLEKVDYKNIAELIAFWQYTAVYSSWLRNVDPFDQPQVEKSKEIAFMMRKAC